MTGTVHARAHAARVLRRNVPQGPWLPGFVCGATTWRSNEHQTVVLTPHKECKRGPLALNGQLLKAQEEPMDTGSAH
eukprot:10622897-Alexandrium_andersonii.AAC.1